MTRKIMCILFSFIMIISSSIIAFGESDYKIENNNLYNIKQYIFELNDNGSYSQIDNYSLNNKSNKIIAYKTNNNELFQINSNEYLYKDSENNYIKMDKVNFNINNINASINNLIEKNVSEESINRIKDTISEQKAIGNDELEISIYVPADIVVDDENVNITLATSNGQTRDTIEEYRNMHSDMQKLKGSTCVSKAKSLISVVISAVGTTSKTVSLFSAGTTLVKLYCNSTNISSVIGTANDSFWYDIVYDKLIKDTDVYYNGTWLSGCTSYKVWANYLYTDQYYTSGGKHVTRSDSINKVHYSKNYQDPVETARTYMGGGWTDSPVKIKVLDTLLTC